jgi:hypothetical protein
MTSPWLQLHCSDVNEGCSEIADNYVDVAIFSPPYKQSDGFSAHLMKAIGKLLSRALKPGGWAFMNFGQLSEDFGRPFSAREQVILGSYLSDQGAHLVGHQTYTWIKSLVIDGAQRAHFQPT